jgi:hypothetical protein
MLAIQILRKTDLSTIRGVLMMSLWMWCGVFGITVVTGIYGFTFGPRRARIQAVAAETDYV